MKLPVATLGLALAVALTLNLVDVVEADELRLEVVPSEATLVGSDASVQIVATRRSGSGSDLLDATERVRYECDQANIAEVSATGLIRPRGDGFARIRVIDGSQVVTIAVRVSDYANQRPVGFVNEVVPILSKNGCNSGGCHGKASGQNGFKLSLLGFDPALDYEAIAIEGKGRRVFPAAPESSLLLLKATAKTPHGGGKRVEPGSAEFQTLKRWVANGLPYAPDKEPKLVKLSIEPAHRIGSQQSTQQLRVTAHYDNASTQDITRLAQYQSNAPDLANVDTTGKVETFTSVGEAAIMARFNGQVAVARLTVPSVRLARDWTPPSGSDNIVDRAIFAKLKDLGLRPSETCTDHEFLRRLSLDVRGVLPSTEEAKAFLSDSNPAKRHQLVDRYLKSPEYADHFAMKWSTILRNKRSNGDQSLEGSFVFHSWIRHAIASNMPYDQFVASIVGAKGQYRQNPPVVWYRQVNQLQERVDDTAQLFLGLRIQCARCHHHPYERWSQDDYFGFASFFSRVRDKKSDNTDPMIALAKSGMELNPTTRKLVPPTPLGGKSLESLSIVEDPRDHLVRWLKEKDNPYLARAVVNRYWKHFLGRGLVEPEDDFRVTNPPSNPALLDALTQDFVDHRYDLKHLIRLIVTSRTYDRSSMPNPDNSSDKRNFARYYSKRLSAEAMLDAINAATNSKENFANLPQGTRATQLPDDGFNSAFLESFGRPKRESVCECERIQDANLSQTLQMLNSGEIQGKVASKTGRAAVCASDKRPDSEKIEDLYWACLSRKPSTEELEVCLAYLKDHRDPKKPAQAYEDLLWALINSKEFLFIH